MAVFYVNILFLSTAHWILCLSSGWRVYFSRHRLRGHVASYLSRRYVFLFFFYDIILPLDQNHQILSYWTKF